MPTKSKLVYLPSAQHDFEEIVKYHITEAGTPYARKIYATMKTAINRLRDFPLMGQTHPDPILAANGYRKLVLTKTYVGLQSDRRHRLYLRHCQWHDRLSPTFEVITVLG